MSVSEIHEHLQLYTIPQRRWFIQPCSAIFGKVHNCSTFVMALYEYCKNPLGEGLHEGLDWLVSALGA